MRIRTRSAGLLLLLATLASAADSGSRFVRKLSLPTRQTVVVSEGDLEARSIGSYAVRVYSAEASRPGDTTFFSAGTIRPRAGTVEKVFMAKLGKNSQPALVVTVRSAGSGGYVSADAFVLSRNTITLLTSVAGLPASADPVAALSASLQRKGGK